MYAAADRGYVFAVEFFLAKGAEVDEKCNSGWTALHSAASNGHVNAVRALLAAGAKINQKNNNEKTGR